MWHVRALYVVNVLTCISESAPGRSKEEVMIVAGDGFFDQKMCNDTLGFTNAAYITDVWHLLDQGLCKLFGKSGYILLKV